MYVERSNGLNSLIPSSANQSPTASPPNRKKRLFPRSGLQSLAGGICASLLTMLSNGVAHAVEFCSQTLPPEIVTQAAALKNDPDLIYEYVYNNIETVPQHGSLKGPLGTLLDGAGTAVDQAELMASMLHAAGYTTAALQTGIITIDAAHLTGWLGTDDSEYSSDWALTRGGFNTARVAASGQLLYLNVPWAWVKVQIGGAYYVFDPAGKRVNGYARTERIANLGSALGYSQSTFVSDAVSGATITDRTVAGINRDNVRNDLKTYSQNLVSYIRANNPAAKPSDIIGGASVVPLAVGTQQRLTSLPYLPGMASDETCESLSDLRTTMTLFLQGSSGSVTLNTSDIYGHRLSLFFDDQLRPVLRLDGVTLSTGSAATPESMVAIRTAVDHPYATSTADFINDERLKVAAVENGAYVISSGWGPVGRGLVEKRRGLLAKAIADNPGNPNAEAVLGETLNMIGYTWLAERAAVRQTVDQLTDTVTVGHHAIGIVGIKSGGPFVDFPIGLVALTQRNDHPSSGALTASESAAFFTDTEMASILESGVLEQTQPGAVAVSTAKLIDIASQSDTIYDINNDAVSGDDATYYTNTIRPLLVNTWAPSDLTLLDSLINSNDRRVIAPLTGNITVNGLWTGVGYYSLTQDGLGFGALITGGLSGGVLATTQTEEQTVSYTESAAEASVGSSITTAIGIFRQAWSDFAGTLSDPVNRVSGSFTYDHVDLTVGSAGFPIGLGFERSYDSTANLNAGPYGRGWMHNFAITAKKDSDGFEGLAVNSPINGASAIATLYVVQDLMNSTGAKPLDRMIMTSIAVTWLMEQLTNNVVTITEPANVSSFVLLADGSYNAPFGSSNRLHVSSSAYVLTQADGTVLTFNDDASSAPGSIASWHSPAGPTVTYTYDGNGLLTSVSTGSGAAGTNRTLALSYDGSNRLAAVADGTGRSVSYSYSGNGNLTGYTDPLGNVTTYAYDASNRMTQYFPPTSTGKALVTNAYDDLGRVTTQTDADDNVSYMYFAGRRTETVDPLGNPHVYYFSPRGKVLTEIDELGRKTVNAYDGRDRLITTTLPEGGSISFSYDATTNPWANNVASVTRNSKPGSPLSPIVQSFTYDPVWNKVATATDGRGIVTKNAYDEATGNLTRTIADYSTDTGHLNATTTFAYNTLGQMATVTDPVGTVTQNAYDGFGNLISITRDSGRLNQTTTLVYSDQGNVISVTNPNGNVTKSTYDAARRATTIALPPTGSASGSAVTTFVYDADGRVLETVQSVEGAELRKTTSVYTALGQVAKTTDANGNVTRFTYDAGGRLTRVTDPKGWVTTYSYDALGRRTSVSNDTIQMGALLQQSYTDDGLLASLTDANDNTTNFAYDGFDRLVTRTYPSSSKESLTYDANGNVLIKKTRFGDTISYSYDALNRMTAMTPPAGTPAVTYIYDLAGRRIAVSGNGPTINAPVPPGGVHASYGTSYTYDALNRPVTATWDNAPAQTSPTASSVTFSHGYDANNRRISEAVTDNAWLSSPSSPSSTSYTSNELNQYTTVGGESLTYNANGHLAEGPVFDRQPSASAGTTNFISDANGREVLEYNGSNGTILRWYAYGIGPNEVLNSTDVQANTRKTLIPDAHGSIIAMLDSGTGTLTKQGYQTYGESDNAAASFAYTGQRLDVQTGLYYYRARMYSPALGRFLQADPIGYVGGTNLYSYVGNDPLNRIDPFGLLAEELNEQYGQPTLRLLADPETPLAFFEIASGGALFLGSGGADVAAGLGTGGLGSIVLAPTAAAGMATGAAVSADGIIRLEGAIERAFGTLYMTPPGEAGGSSGSDGDGPFGETFDNPAAAIGDVHGVADPVAKVATKNADIAKYGYTETHYYLDSNGVQNTVFYNPTTKRFGGGHTSTGE